MSECEQCAASMPRKFETDWYEGKWVHHDGRGWKMRLCKMQDKLEGGCPSPQPPTQGKEGK